MKLRLDENTLNKYITEAFKQELKPEKTLKIFQYVGPNEKRTLRRI